MTSLGGYVTRRILVMIPVALGTTLLIFTLVFALPGDPTAGMCGEQPCPPSFVAAFRAEHGLDEPLLVRYGEFLGGILSGDLGAGYDGEPIAGELAARFPVTGKLTGVALGAELLLGAAAGVLAAIRRGSYLDALITAATLMAVATPVIVLAPLAQWMFGVRLHWFPVTSGPDPGWYDLLLPGLALGSLSLAYVARLVRVSVIEGLHADFVRTARAKGLPWSQVLRAHVLRPALVPVVTFVGADAGALLGGAVVTERVFNIPGIGGYIVAGIRDRDSAAVAAAVTALVLLVCLISLVVDLLYGFIDPRMRDGLAR